jgi:hypothetical protein
MEVTSFALYTKYFVFVKSGAGFSKTEGMKTIALAAVLALGVAGFTPISAQVKDDLKTAGDKTGDAVKDASKDTAHGAKKGAKATGHEAKKLGKVTEKGFKKGTHKVAKETGKGADKVADKTETPK